MSRDAPIISSEFDRPAVEDTLKVLGHLRIQHETLMMSVNRTPSAWDLETDLLAASVADATALSTNWPPSPPVAVEFVTVTCIASASRGGS